MMQNRAIDTQIGGLDRTSIDDDTKDCLTEMLLEA